MRSFLSKQATLLQNYPNPFNPETWIPFQLTADATVTIQIYNATGQLVRTLALGNKNAGVYTTQD
ncbi:T9SS type A sorting domain-containing protein [Candidatus Poribacteria bacterium]|nr:T9SS type A sorting domain-containing protein [Candidatus Poribacteria bacterium]